MPWPLTPPQWVEASVGSLIHAQQHLRPSLSAGPNSCHSSVKREALGEAIHAGEVALVDDQGRRLVGWVRLNMRPSSFMYQAQPFSVSSALCTPKPPPARM